MTTAAAPGTIRHDARPPITMDVAPAHLGAAAGLRPTVVPRAPLRPRLIADRSGLAPDDPAVRRYWGAVIGPGAVTDLLRLVAAAIDDRAVLRPIHLTDLVREGLALWCHGHLWVAETIPYLSERHTRRLHPALRGEYLRVIANR